MARSRNIKPGFFKNDILAELQPLTRLLFIGLWCLADREGRLEDRPKRIKAEVLPYDNCDIDKLLTQLDGARFIHRYQVDGNEYIEIPNFTKHQNPHMKEQASEIPAPNKHSASTVQEPNEHGTCPADSLNPLIDSLNPITDSLHRGGDSKLPPPQTLINITLNDKSEHGVTQEDVDKWSDLYPAVDVMQELRKMKGWCDADPKRRKTTKGINRFIVGWLGRQQDKGQASKPKPKGREWEQPDPEVNYSDPEMIFRRMQKAAAGKGRE